MTSSTNFMNEDEYTVLCSAVTLQSQKEGFFQQILNNITSSVDEHWFENFGRLTSNVERIRECLTHKKVKDGVYQMMDNVQEIYRGKSIQISTSRRQEADHLFATGRTERALLTYTQSIIRAPLSEAESAKHDEGTSLALALWGRSKVLYHLDKINFCLEDVKLVLKEKISHNLKLDAFWMMAKCYMRLKQFDHARITLNLLLKMAANDEHWTKKIQSKLKELPAASRTKGQSSAINGKGSVCENTSMSKLDLSYNEQAGKFFVAGENINTGDKLLVESPFVSCLLAEKFGSHCQNCLRRLEIAIPCEHCSAVAFCSISCRNTAQNTFHKFECRFLDLLIGSGMSILCFAALRIVSQRNLKYFLDTNLNVEEQNGGHAYATMYNMVTHDNLRTPRDFLSRTLMALFLLAVLKKGGYFPHSKKIDELGPEEIFLASVLLRNLEVLQFNAHEISEAVVTNDSKSLRSINVGIGLYLTASKFNHDCFSSVSRYFDGCTLIVRAIRPIPKGALVGDNYGAVFSRMNREERRTKLKSRYWFECQCTACSEDWPTLNNLNKTEYRMRCSLCKACIISHSDSNIESCTECQKPLVKIPELNECMKILNEYLEMSLEDLSEEQVSRMCKMLDLLDTILCPPHKIYAEIGHKLTQSWMRAINYESGH